MTTREAVIATSLARQLGRRHPEWRTTALEVVGRGLDTLVFGAEAEPFGAVVFKVPWERKIANDNDLPIEAARLLRQEATCGRHLRAHGVPTPEIHALEIGNAGEGGLDFLLLERIEHDGSPADPMKLGALLRRIHEAPLAPGALVRDSEGDLRTTLARRLIRRSRAVERLAGAALAIPREDELLAWLAWKDERRCLLHMDFRPANLLTLDGRVRAVIDWANALRGDPALELARIAEYGELVPGFLRGYGEPHWFARLPPPVELLYRLDAAVMLAVVHLSEAPDPVRARPQVARVMELYAELGRSPRRRLGRQSARTRGRRA